MFQSAKFGWNGGNGGALNRYNGCAAIRKRASGSGAFSRSSFASSHNVNCASNSLASQTTQTSWRVPIGANPLRRYVPGSRYLALAINALFRQVSSIGAIGAEREDKHF